LTGNNRIIVKHGLSEYATSHVTSFGFSSLMNVAKVDCHDLMQEDIAFRIAPIINASGRMSCPDIAYRLLMEKDSSTADLIAEGLIDLNRDRKKAQKKTTNDAIEMIKKNKSAYRHGALLYCPDWHIGIVGIVASKIVEYLGRPALVIGRNGKAYKGSGRTIPDVNIKDILDSIGDKIFASYGGHANAVGVTLKPEIVEDNKLDLANQIFNTECEKYFNANNIGETYNFYDIDIKPASVTMENARKIKKFMYPYSEENPEPIFKLNKVTPYNVKIREGDGWSLTTFMVKQGEDNKIPFSFKQFNSLDKQDLEGHTVNIYFQFPQKLDTTYVDINVIKIEKA
jgi:single-stranded-DNA-specific exonuclease